MKVVVDRNIPLAREAFEPLGELLLLGANELSAIALRDADALVVRSETKITPSLLEGSRVKFVGTATIGVDHVDLEYLKLRGIAFASAPGCNSNSVKEYVVAALLHLSSEKGIALKGKSIGVVGVGNVGSKVAKAAEALGMRVLQNDPPLAREKGGSGYLPLDELMGCDVITLHVPLTRTGPDATRHLFDAHRLARLKPGVVFINTSRGGVVDTAALRRELASARLTATVIDVWENEPQIDPDLLSLVTLGTAHIAGYSLEGKVNGTRVIREAVASFFGISAPWDPQTSLPKPAIPDVDIVDESISEETILHNVVKRCYDITADDTLLRRMLSFPEKDQGAYFSGIRGGYRTRREFSNVTVHLPRGQHSLAQTLIALGFKTTLST